MTMYYSNYSVVFVPQTRQILIFEEFIYNLYFLKSIKTSNIYVEDCNFQEKEAKGQLNNTIQSKSKSDQTIQSRDNLETINDDAIQIGEEEKNNEISKQQNKQNSDQEIQERSVNVQQLDESDEFDSKKRQYTEEFFKYMKIEKYSEEIQIKEFILNIINRKLLSIDRLIVYFKLRQLNKYQIEDAQNYGVDYTLYGLSTNNQDESQESKVQKHFHSVYLLKIGGPFNMWLGYARIAHNVNKVMINAQISYNHKYENDLCSFDQVIKDWFQQKNIKIECEDQNKSLKPVEDEFEIQLNKLIDIFDLNLISFGISKDN